MSFDQGEGFEQGFPVGRLPVIGPLIFFRQRKRQGGPDVKVPLREGDLDAVLPELPDDRAVDVGADLVVFRGVVDPEPEPHVPRGFAELAEQDVGFGVFQDLGVLEGDVLQAFEDQVQVRSVRDPHDDDPDEVQGIFREPSQSVADPVLEMEFIQDAVENQPGEKPSREDGGQDDKGKNDEGGGGDRRLVDRHESGLEKNEFRVLRRAVQVSSDGAPGPRGFAVELSRSARLAFSNRWTMYSIVLRRSSGLRGLET